MKITYFEIIKALTVVGNTTVFLVFAFSIQWQLGVLEWFLGIMLANAPILLYTLWFKRMAEELQGTWANIFAYTPPLLVGTGGILTYALMIKLDNFGFWLYFVVPFGQALVFNIFLAFAMQAILWIDTPNAHS